MKKYICKHRLKFYCPFDEEEREIFCNKEGCKAHPDSGYSEEDLWMFKRVKDKENS